MLSRYALQLPIAADPAVGRKQAPKRSATAAKPGFAGLAAPGKNSAQGQQVVNDGAAVRARRFGLRQAVQTSSAWVFGLLKRLGPGRAGAHAKRAEFMRGTIQ
jgi:hypothetical protein